MTSIDPIRSPCRPHPCSVEHADVVMSYRELVRLWSEHAEIATGGYDTELSRHAENHPRPSFKDYLRCQRQL